MEERQHRLTRPARLPSSLPIINTLTVLALVALLFALTVAVPVLYASSEDSGRYQVVITLGAVIRGDTPHVDAVVAEVSKGVAAVARDTGVPVIFGVPTTDTVQRAFERAGIKSKRVWSYSLQALKMGSLMAALPG
jgi:6,7-dimethyl-8-ribityllumazine synthase